MKVRKLVPYGVGIAAVIFALALLFSDQVVAKKNIADSKYSLRYLIFDICLDQKGRETDPDISGLNLKPASDDDRLSEWKGMVFWVAETDDILLENNPPVQVDENVHFKTCSISSGIYGFELRDDIPNKYLLHEFEKWAFKAKDDPRYVDLDISVFEQDGFGGGRIDARYTDDPRSGPYSYLTVSLIYAKNAFSFSFTDYAFADLDETHKKYFLRK